ncbi:TRO, partial [Symbiodinium sp. CCMP2456]
VTKARISSLGEEHEEVRRAQDKVVHRIVSPQVLQKIESSEDTVTQEMFVRMIWPKIRSFDLKYVLGCFRRFFAQEALSRILSSVTKAHKAGQRAEVGMSAGDLRWVFDVLDEDDDGTLSVREMVQLGALEVEDAVLLTEHLDKDEEGEVSLKELMSLVGGFVGDDFSDSLKGMYASSSMVPKELWQSKSMR